MTEKQLMIVERTLMKNDCFYCMYCQRIKVNGLLVDRYCEKYLCLIDEVEDCQEFIHVKNERIIEKRWIIEDDEPLQIIDSKGEYEAVCVLYSEDAPKVVDLLNKLEEENRQLRLELDTHKHPLWSTREAEKIVNELKQENEKLKQSVSNLKETIIKITIAYQRKYDRTIVDLVDEVHDEDITDLIKELQK